MNSAKSVRDLQLAAVPRVNLMPQSELDRRSTSAIARRWIGVVALALVVALVVIGGAYAYSMLASNRLASEENRTQQLLAQISELAPVSEAVARRSSLTAQREQAMANDIDWAPVITRLEANLPGDAQISGYAMAPGAAPQDDDPIAEIGMLGTVTVTTGVPMTAAIASEALSGAESAQVIEVVQITNDDGVYDATIVISLDQTIYTRDYAPRPAEDQD